MTTIIKASKLSKKMHKGQTRKHGKEPYFSHPDAIAHRLINLLKNDLSTGKISKDEYKNIIAAAYLHDVLEDTTMEEYELRRIMGDKITDLVVELTSEEEMKMGKAKYLSAKISSMSNQARLIKFADREHNVSDLHSIKNQAWARKYARETQYILTHAKFTPSNLERILITSIKEKIGLLLK